MNDLTKLYDSLGGFKTYQKRIFFLCSFTAFVGGLTYIEDPFTFYENLHRCYVPQCDSSVSNYEEPFVNFTIPYDDDDDDDSTYDGCYMYDFVGPNDTQTCDPNYFDPYENVECENYVYDTSVFRTSLVTSFDLVCGRSYLISLGGTIFLVGIFIGTFLIGAFSDKFGRKNAVVFAGVLTGVFGICCSLSPNYPTFLVFRLLMGAGNGPLFPAALVLIMEYLGIRWRTFLSMILNIPFALGELTAGILAYLIRDWRWLHFSTVAPAFLLVICYWIMPESIRWLMSVERIEEAKEIVDEASRVNKIPSPSHLLQRRISIALNEDKIKAKNRSLLNLYRSPASRKKTLLLFFCWSVTTLSYNGLSRNTGNLSGNLFINFSLTMLIEIPSYVVSYFMLDKIGRRMTLSLSYIFAGATCILSGLLPSDLKWGIVSLSLLGKFGIAGAYGSIYVFTVELYPTEYRSIGVGSCATVAHIVAILSPLITSLSEFYQPIPLLIFGILSFFAGFCILLLPETLGYELPQTLEECEDFGKDQELCQLSCFCFSTKKQTHRQNETT